MHVIFEQHISGTYGSFGVGETLDVEEKEALRFIQKGIAKPKSDKEYKTLLTKIEKEEALRLQKEKELQALLFQEELEHEKSALEQRVQEIKEILEGLHA